MDTKWEQAVDDAIASARRRDIPVARVLMERGLLLTDGITTAIKHGTLRALVEAIRTMSVWEVVGTVQPTSGEDYKRALVERMEGWLGGDEG